MTESNLENQLHVTETGISLVVLYCIISGLAGGYTGIFTYLLCVIYFQPVLKYS